jgi:hypothetical protein
VLFSLRRYKKEEGTGRRKYPKRKKLGRKERKKEETISKLSSGLPCISQVNR